MRDGVRRLPSAVWLSITVLLLMAILGALLVAERIVTRRAIDAEAARGQAAAVLLASSFRRELEKFRLGAVVLARDPEAVAALSRRTPADIAVLNVKFEALSLEMKAAAIYLLDGDGTTVAASNWRLPNSFVGLSYGFRSYFKEALGRGAARQFALGTRSGRPGLYLARRIESSSGAALGVVVVKVEFDALEAEWRESNSPAFATNRRGIILVTSIPAWRFQTTTALDDATRRSIRADLEFGDSALAPNPPFAAGRVARAGTTASYTRPLVETVQTVDDGWSVHVLSATSRPVAAAVGVTRLILLTLVMGAVGLGALFINRRRAAVARAGRVADARLEEFKRRLAQANKLATLGQIAAGVGHEVNQPVTAIGTYAYNGTLLIDAGRMKEARENMERIVTLTERIGSITGELRGFARRATGEAGPVAIDGAIRGAMLLLGDRVRTSGSSIDHTEDMAGIEVIAEHARLEQVLVNLLQNALDAGGPGAVITIALSTAGEHVDLTISDQGPGLSKQARASLFQPFSTSKPDGLGLGLVISRDIMVDFGGDLIARSPSIGAEFVMRLRNAAWTN